MRLWKQGTAAVASGLLGLMTLDPLMHGATDAMITTAATSLIQQTQPPVQGDLLTTFGILAEPLLPTDAFLRLVTKERLMSSDLFTTFYQDRESVWRQTMQQSIEAVILARFPHAPLQLNQILQRISAPALLQEVLQTALIVPDLSALERVIQQAAVQTSA